MTDIHSSPSSSGKTTNPGGNSPTVEVRHRLHATELEECRQFVRRLNRVAVGHDPRWLQIVCDGLDYQPFYLLARHGAHLAGVLPLALVNSFIFGRFLVSLPYVNSSGVIANDNAAIDLLIDKAVTLADEHSVRYLELRHECPFDHEALNAVMTSKVIMRLSLAENVCDQRAALTSKVRNKLKKGERQGFELCWGREELLEDFYTVFSRNMRDLGTPVYGRPFFSCIIENLADSAEFCVVRDNGKPIACALLVHGNGVTEVPSASSLREYNPSNANDLMYWGLLSRAIERGQGVFDFGRCTPESNTFVFKKKWGAKPTQVNWQYYDRSNSVGSMRIENGKYQRAVRAWQNLPVWVTRLIGPSIVRGIP